MSTHDNNCNDCDDSDVDDDDEDDEDDEDDVDENLIESDIEQGSSSKALKDSNGEQVTPTRLK